MDYKNILRPNILRLEPYRCARDDYSEGILLDANENTHGTAVHDLSTEEEEIFQFNKYPDPHQIELKKLISEFRGGNITAENLYLGVGSDEAIDSLLRATCKPGVEKMLICPPTYGMYSVSADINDVGIVKVPLDLDTFDIRPDELLKTLNSDPSIKLVYICSPGNPTGTYITPEKIFKVLEGWTNGLVVVDEAYVDFTDGKPSLAPLVNKYPRLVVLQTLSKSFGLAGLRLGMCFAYPDLAAILNAMKAPYNISSATSIMAKRALAPNSIALMKKYVASIQTQRQRLKEEFGKIKGLGRIRGGLDANFILVEVLDKDLKAPSNERANAIYKDMAKNQKVVVRFRGKELGCEGCLRISIGTEKENSYLLEKLKEELESN